MCEIYGSMNIRSTPGHHNFHILRNHHVYGWRLSHMIRLFDELTSRKEEIFKKIFCHFHSNGKHVVIHFECIFCSNLNTPQRKNETN